jgi:hypothetical protein
MLALFFCGALSVGIYWGGFAAPFLLYPLAQAKSPADIGMMTGYSLFGCARYVGAVLALFGLYGVGMNLARGLRGKQAALLIVASGLAAAIVLVQVYPYAATDVFLYIVRGRVLGVYGQNSLVVPPAAFPTEPYLPFASEWTEVPSPYGPLWELTAALLARLGDGGLVRSLLVFKGFALLTYLACLALIAAILWASKPENLLVGVLAFAWNPLVLLETHAMAHNDLYMVFFVLLSLWFWERKQYALVFMALTLGGLVKYVPFLLLLPALLLLKRRLNWRSWWRSVLLGGFGSGLLVVLFFAPLWPGRGAWDIAQQAGRVHTSVAAFVIVMLYQLAPQLPAFQLGLGLARLLFVSALAWSLIQMWRRDAAVAEGYYRPLYAGLVWAAVAFGYWYVAWLVALMPFLSQRELWRRTVFFSCSGLLSVAVYTFGIKVLDLWAIYLLAVPMTFALPYLLSHLIGARPGAIWCPARARIE